MSMACRTHWKKRNAYKVLVGKPEGKRSLGRYGRRWKDNIQMYFREMGSNDTGCIHVVQGRNQRRALVNNVMNLWVP
jgi:hypothetical protein